MTGELCHALDATYAALTRAPRYAVEVWEDGWLQCVREDLSDDGDTDNLPPAVFSSAREADAFIVTLRGLMHCGGGDTAFRVVLL
jgi:hypothetical protein